MRRLEHVIQRKRPDGRTLAASCPSEWAPVPLGPLGRVLITDIERYLEFFEIACAEVPLEPFPAVR